MVDLSEAICLLQIVQSLWDGVSNSTMGLHTDIPTRWHNTTGKKRRLCMNKTNKVKDEAEGSAIQRATWVPKAPLPDHDHRGVRQRPPSASSLGLLPSHLRIRHHAYSVTQVRNTCWSDFHINIVSQHTLPHRKSKKKKNTPRKKKSCSSFHLPNAHLPLSKSLPKLVLLIMLFNDESLQGITLRLVLTLPRCWPTYARPLWACMWGTIVPDSPRVLFLKQRPLWTCSQVKAFWTNCFSLGTEEICSA